MLSRISVGRQLGLAFGLVVVLVLALALTAWSRILAMHGEFESVVDTTLPALTALGEVNDKLQVVRISELKHLAALTMPAKDREEVAVKAAVQGFNAALTRYNTTAAGLADPALQKELTDAVAKFHALRSTFFQMSNSAAGAEGERVTDASDFFDGPSQLAYQNAYQAVQKLWQGHLNQAEQAKAKGSEAVLQANRVLASVAAASVLLSIALAFFISRNLLLQLGGQPAEVAAMATSISNADLSSAIVLRPGDAHSVVSAMARMQASLTQIVQSIRQGADGVATASSEIAQGNHDLSARTEHQASALEQTAASMEELSSTVKQNADSARTANQLAMSASTVAVRGGEVVGKVVETMKGINDSSRKIADIISVIDGIAFQTNILALNAAVEAARAGEQGRGFAVVASEVRSLASRSADAAKEIKSLISASVQRVEQGVVLVDQAGSTMTEVVGSIRRVTEIMGEISAASSEQSTGVSQIGEAVTQMDQVNQQNAALVEQMAAAASGLKSQASDLVRVVAVFNLEAETPALALAASAAPVRALAVAYS
ncbi:methyl-accepting chemotaxis protein [Rhodoferax sp.]|uniref:methyl-accepting chemotaxis protein n=1 Tax=Rhodoferax sp. TaxID=50421 RepID=UPI00374DD288